MAADVESLRQELSALRERLEELDKRVCLGAAAGPAESQTTGLQVPGQPARVVEEVTADAVVAARLRADLTDPNTLAATRFEGTMRASDGQLFSWAESGRLTAQSGTAAARQMGKVLGALGREARVKLMLMLWDGEKGAQELAEATGLTTGSLYHNMRGLMTMRWVDAPQRNRYVLTQRGRQALVMASALTQTSPSDASWYPP